LNEGSGALRTLTADMANVEGVAERMAASNMAGLQGSLKELRSALEGLAIAVGDAGLLEFLTDLAKRVTAFVSELTKTNPELLRWGLILAGAAATVGPMIYAVGGLAGSLSNISSVLAGTHKGFAALTGVLRDAPAMW